MVFSRKIEIALCLTIFLLLYGCSSSGGETPTSGLTPNNVIQTVGAKAVNNMNAWEFGEVIINETGAEVIPDRTTAFTCNIVKFLQPPAGNTANLTVTLDSNASNYANAYVELDAKLTHPFPGTEYWGFDTRVVVFAGGSTTGKHDNTVKYPTPNELRMINADGYTRWFNRTEFGPIGKIFGYTEGVMAPTFTPSSWSTVNGYKYFANGISSTQTPANPAEATRGVFNSGSVTRRMKLQFPKVSNPFKFKYSVVTSWDTPSTIPPTNVNQFPPTANCQEAYQIWVTQDPSSTAFYNPDNATFGGDLILTIEVWDWQASGNPASQISGIWLESPTLLSNQGGVIKITDNPLWTVSPGSSPNSVKYSGTLSNVTPNAVSNQEILVTVESADPTTYDSPITGDLYPAKPLAAYQLYTATILNQGTPPQKSIKVTYPNGGENLIVGGSATITWTWTGNIANVVIEYSTDGGVSYPHTIIASTPCDGSHQWSPIPNTPTTTAKVRITEAGASPEAQDASDNNFTISTTAEKGWNPVPGQTGIIVNSPAPNQSTVSPDLGIQNNKAGEEGAWMVDQQGGIPDGTPYFYDYKLDWSGPDDDKYTSKFNYNFCPFGRHDVSANGIAIMGCSANTNQINPPTINDPLTAIWYLSFILADDGAAGALYFVRWGDAGTTNPPTNDPDAQPWFHTADCSGGMPGQAGDPMTNSMIWFMPYSRKTGAPAIPAADLGRLNIGLWTYPFITSPKIYRLGFPEYTNLVEPPYFNAFDVKTPEKCRIAADNDSYLTFTGNALAVMTYLLDSSANWYGTGFEVDFGAGSYNYINLANSLKIRKDDATNYVAGATAVDLEMLPTIRVLNGGNYETEKNWCAVLFDKGNNTWVVRVYRVDWTADAGNEISIVGTTNPLPGTPLCLDVDYINFKIHVLAKDGNDIKATVLQYTP